MRPTLRSRNLRRTLAPRRGLAIISQDEIAAFLARASSYDGDSSTVERIDTHCSLIFLVGERAYKMKRAVRFSYLDYSTLELRERFCRAEYALGQRLAPVLYRGIHRVTREPDGRLAIDGSGAAVEWLVEMRRFDQAQLFDRLAEGGRLTADLMQQLADAIAEFHRIAEPAPDHGGSAAMRRTVEDCRENLVRTREILAAEDVTALYGALLALWQRAAPLLDRRRSDGRVRHCHGDLHLRNICLIDGKPTLFDGIEFSDEIASIDVLYDLAFLLMDLSHRGHDELGNRVFNRYLDRTSEADGLAAMPFFLSLRAAIRAHVEGASIARQQDPAAAANATRQSRSYLALALALARPAAPRLVAVGGLSGTGKTTLAHRLAPGLGPVPGARIVRSDVLRKRLFGVPPEMRLPEEAYGRDISARVYDALYQATAEALRGGYAVIADAVFLQPDERAAIAAAARVEGVPFTGLWLEAPADVLTRRVAAREGDASDAGVEVVRRQLDQQPGSLAWHRLDARGDLDATAVAARATLAG